MNYIRTNKHKEVITVITVITVIFICYISNLTTAGLWEDEAIEYFFSNYISAFPYGLQNILDKPTNMYDRICSTYQPPLYNALMFFWLRVADNEIWFRFAGVLTTFIGACGLYLALKKLSDNFLCALFGLTIYLSAFSVRYYAMECAEYNLMLCMECWTLYYMARLLTNEKYKIKDTIGFLCFAILSAYSQYGSILALISMWIIILFNAVYKKNSPMTRHIIVGTIITAFIAALPLLYFFLIPQLNHQQAGESTHSLFFIHGFINSFISGIYTTLDFLFSRGTLRIKIICVICCITTISAVFLRKYKLNLIITNALLTYCIYFFLTASSYYAYNSASPKQGCENLGGRYTLFMAPIIIITIIYALYCIINQTRNYKIRKLGIIISTLFGVLFVTTGIKIMVKNPDYKEDARDIYEKWSNRGGYNVFTVISDFPKAAFMYYYIHDKKNKNITNILGLDRHCSNSNEYIIKKELQKKGTFKHNKIFFIGRNENNNHMQEKRIDNVFISNGYKIDRIYNKEESLTLYTK